MSAAGGERVEVDLSPQTLEDLAGRIAELVAERRTDTVDRLLDARELAAVLGVRPRWVHEHASELGAIRLGEGRRSHLRFDAGEAIARLPRHPDGTAPAGPPRDSLSRRRRATLLARRRPRPGIPPGTRPSGADGGRHEQSRTPPSRGNEPLPGRGAG